MTTTYDKSGNKYRRDLPMPGARIRDGRIVVASCDQECGEYDLLVLGPSAPFYSVLLVSAEDLSILHEETYPNIIPATESYSSAIGGY